jgi:hypothetical protein
MVRPSVVACVVYLTTLPMTDYLASNDSILVNNELEIMWKRSWSTLSFCPEICLEGIKKQSKTYVKVISVPAEIRIRPFPNIDRMILKNDNNCGTYRWGTAAALQLVE